MSWSAKFHLASTWAWLPITAVIFYFHLENKVWLVLLLSLYANAKTDWGDYHSSRAAEDEDESTNKEKKLMGSNDTTVTAATAGTALGTLVGAGLSAVLNGAISPEVCVGSCGIIGAFTFGRIFG